MTGEPVKILGAGIAGLTAAIYLAREGIGVRVIEKKKKIGSKFGFHINALRLYEGNDFFSQLEELGVKLNPSTKIVRMVKKSPGFLRKVEGDLYQIFERGKGNNSIEMQLYRAAVENGAVVEFGRSVSIEEVDIIATGTPLDRFNILGVGYAFALDGSNLSPDEAILIYDHNIAPAGYISFLPSQESFMLLSVSFTLMNLQELFARLDAALVKNDFFKDIVANARRLRRVAGMGYYAKDPISKAIWNGKMYIGEAAGFQDARRGFGIRYAVLSGILAAKSIVEKLDYQKLLREYFGDEFSNLTRKRKRINRMCSNQYFDRWVLQLQPVSAVKEYLSWKAMETADVYNPLADVGQDK